MKFAQADTLGADGVRPQLYRLIAGTIAHLVWSARPDGSLRFFNSHVFEYAGMAAGVPEGWGSKPVIHQEEWKPRLERGTRSPATGTRFEIEYRLPRAEMTKLAIEDLTARITFGSRHGVNAVE